MAGGVADAYPNPRPMPMRIPNPRIHEIQEVEKEMRIKPEPVRIPPMTAVILGLSLSWRRPAKIMAKAKTRQQTA